METTVIGQTGHTTGSIPPAYPPSNDAIKNHTGCNTAQTPIVQILIGGKTYLVNIKKIPYLLSMCQFQQRSGLLCPNQMPVHAREIPFFETINFAVSHGLGHFLRYMPTDLAQYRQLCWTLDYLVVDVLEGRELHNVVQKIEQGVSNWILLAKGGEHDKVTVLAGHMGDAAFRLLYMIVSGKVEGRHMSGDRDWDEEARENPAFRATRLIMINVRLWDQGAKRILLRAYQDRFGMSNELQMCYDFCVKQWTTLLGA
ncbi:hypothetical protein CONLIGDRAFT_682868 [Coniochaeta ligniaria NRRL 30616]|uniref:Uncharacterized protein n=1 Tax=Coniochaeta ligniaria NRRL 30616 TaxID=1408157 RepID=A0A1J7IJV5_9PEZI|nr:hypothetical protein CONLIGDRAFT_682868 [Coniochaeta ligniaria NRRL 30616]